MIEYYAAIKNVYNARWRGTMPTILLNTESMLNAKDVIIVLDYVCVHMYTFKCIYA